MGKSPLDINKFFVEKYFNKNVFRGVIILSIFLLVFTYWSNDWNYRFEYACCPEDNYGDCVLYEGVKNPEYNLYNNEYYETTTIARGSCVGNLPNSHAKNFNFRVLLLVLGGFVINHLIFMLKYKKIKPTSNKKELDKLKEIIDVEGGKK